jgi:hypothetical protein
MVLRGASDASLTRTLKPAPPLLKNINDIRSRGVTDSDLDAFLKSSSGKEFVESVQKTPIDDLRGLVLEAQQKTKMKGDFLEK